jgi:hypothetical protein
MALGSWECLRPTRPSGSSGGCHRPCIFPIRHLSYLQKNNPRETAQIDSTILEEPIRPFVPMSAFPKEVRTSLPKSKPDVKSTDKPRRGLSVARCAPSKLEVTDPFGILRGTAEGSDLAALLGEARSHGYSTLGPGGGGTEDILRAMGSSHMLGSPAAPRTEIKTAASRIPPDASSAIAAATGAVEPTAVSDLGAKALLDMPLAAAPEAPSPVAAPGAEVLTADPERGAPARRQRVKTGNLKTGRLKPSRQLEASTAVTAAATSTEENVCPRCGERMCTLELELKCEACGILIEGDSTAADVLEDEAGCRRQVFAGRLRIVGPNSGFYQPDLDRSSSADNEAAQLKQIQAEFLRFRQTYMERGGQAFPINACERAGVYYHEIQKRVTKRSINKKAIMAACLRHAAADINYAPDKHVFADMLQLKTRGIARGDNFVRMMKADGHIEIDVNRDMCKPNINTAFSLLRLDGEKYQPLRDAVHAIVKIAIRESIGISSIIRSKVMGATYVALRRYSLAEKGSRSSGGPAADSAVAHDEKKSPAPGSSPALVPGGSPAGKSMFIPTTDLTMQEFCDRCQIRRSTIERFIGPLADFHSYFADAYRAAGLYDGPLVE